MKKLLFLVLGLVLFVPAVNAASYTKADLNQTCDKAGIAAGESTTCTLSINLKEAVTALNFTLTPGNQITIESVTRATVWGGTATITGGVGNVALTSPSEKGPGTVALVTYTIKAKPTFDPTNNAHDCIVYINFENTPPIEVPVTPNPENPNTGSFLPYIIVGSGALLAAGVYMFATRKNKFYKI